MTVTCTIADIIAEVVMHNPPVNAITAAASILGPHAWMETSNNSSDALCLGGFRKGEAATVLEIRGLMDCKKVDDAGP